MEFKPLTLSKTRYDESRKMKALQFNGSKDVRLMDLPVPLITDPTDAIIRITATSISGLDLHLYHNLSSDLKKGLIMGHEGIGYIEDLGSDVKKFKKGDRVMISAISSCGLCDFCKREEWSYSDLTSTSKLSKEKEMSGRHMPSLLGYDPSLEGLQGCQAEFVRVPFADVNLYLIPTNITDRQAILVPDVLSTGYHATELADIKDGDNVVIFGSGPVGMMAQMFSFYRGAKRVIAVDIDQSRLDFARKYFGSEILNSSELDPLDSLMKLMPGGADKIIDCVGSKLPEGFLEKAKTKLGMEKDTPNIMNTAIKMARKNGRITLIGSYSSMINNFNIGALMEKHLTLNGGNVWPHTNYKRIFDAMAAKRINPEVLLTHEFPMSQIDKAYSQLDKHEGGMIKPFIVPDSLYKGQKTYM